MLPLNICGSGLTEAEYFQLHTLAARRRAQRRLKTLHQDKPHVDRANLKRIEANEKICQRIIEITKSPSWIKNATFEELAIWDDVAAAERQLRGYRLQ